jgi:Protein of unknown function (DUF5672)
MLHFMNVAPPDWRFQFLGSEHSVQHLNSSPSIQMYERIGKLDLTVIPSNYSVTTQEDLSIMLTDLHFVDHVLPPGAEHLLMFQSDSIICANNNKTLDDWLGYAYVGAPW